MKNEETSELRKVIDQHTVQLNEERQQHEQELNSLTMQVLELEKFKEEADAKLRDVHNLEQNKTDLERHVQQLIKVRLERYFQHFGFLSG